ncbi:YozD family protein [Priestia megaterium]|uniref:YozD family protein n=1 Tax=Priestia megaterium TaxID=1404 RepID=UPI002E204534|nr:YozD family protein [Priestia megaterium]
MSEIRIDTEELEEYIHQKLLSNHLIPTGKDIEVLGNIFFDFLVDKKVIEEINKRDK